MMSSSPYLSAYILDATSLTGLFFILPSSSMINKPSLTCTTSTYPPTNFCASDSDGSSFFDCDFFSCCHIYVLSISLIILFCLTVSTMFFITVYNNPRQPSLSSGSSIGVSSGVFLGAIAIHC